MLRISIVPSHGAPTPTPHIWKTRAEDLGLCLLLAPTGSSATVCSQDQDHGHQLALSDELFSTQLLSTTCFKQMASGQIILGQTVINHFVSEQMVFC